MNKLHHFPYSHALVLGLAKSGTAAATVLLDSGIDVKVNDKNTNQTDVIVSVLEEKGAEVIVGSHPLHLLDGIDVIVKNPGIPYSNPLLVEAEKRNIPILTEIELAAQLAKENEIIGITGSNGKTTTTTLVAEMLEKSRQPVKLAGNIGVVAAEVAQTIQPEEKLLLELSSFQLMGVETFRPHIAALLNVYDAHLDYHGTPEQYVQAKMNVFVNQTTDDFLIYNADDSRVIEATANARATRVPFSKTKKVEQGAWVEQGVIYFQSEAVIETKDIVLVGEHNIENILAAICVARLAGATKDGINRVLTTFGGVPHRLQYVDEINGRLFYNDSKATNMLATEKALESFTKPTILLAGGLDRGDDFSSLIPALSHVKAMVVFGETKEKLKKLGARAQIQTVKEAKNVDEAVQLAYEMSQAGDVVLLSPACASWDQYKTFEERGNMFIQAVHKLA